MKTASVLCAFVLLAVAPARLELQDKSRQDTPLPDKTTELEADKPLDVTVTQAEHLLRGFTIKVPAGAKSLNIATCDATADIDLLLCADFRPKTLEELEEKCTYVSSSARFNEALTIDKKSEPPLRAGTYYLYAGSLQPEGDDELTFTLAVAFDARPRLVPRARPAYPVTQPEGLQRAIDASVRLDNEHSTGSATVVTPTGLMLTCYHVIEAPGGDYLKKDIFVSVTLDPRKDPVQMYMAETVFADKKRDLALLRVVSDLDGRKLIPKLPWVALGDVSRLMLDEDIRVLGYPGIGGSRSIYGITATRGTVSGFVERKGAVDFIKTDALISAGNSGGGAFNARWELIGIPTEAMHAEKTLEALGYLRPVSAVPGEWTKLIYSEQTK